MVEERTVAEQLSGFAERTRTQSLPPEVVHKIKLHTLDLIGAQVIGGAQKWNRIVRDYCLSATKDGPCGVVASDKKAEPEWAAFANATAGQGFETDDYHPFALLHPSSVAVPSVFAVAQASGCTGDDALKALALGYEVQIRVAMAGQPGINYGRGFHTTSAVGPFGGAAASGYLMELKGSELVSALAIAGSHSGGTVEYTQSGGAVKRMHAGLACMAGIRAATLASLGLTGPPTIFEGNKGFFQAFSGDADVNRAVDALGTRWHLLDTAIKPYFANGLIQAPLGALRLLQSEEGISADDVEEIVVGLDRMGARVTGGIGPRPTDMVGAQFSTHYSLAMALVLGGNQYEHYLHAEAYDFELPDVCNLASRVHVEIDPQCDAKFPERFSAVVNVRTKTGMEVSRRVYAPGSAAWPVTDEEIVEKFRASARSVLGDADAERIVTTVLADWDDGTIDEIMSIVCR